MEVTLSVHLWPRFAPLIFDTHGNYMPFVEGVDTGPMSPFRVRLQPEHADSKSFVEILWQELHLQWQQRPDGRITMQGEGVQVLC